MKFSAICFFLRLSESNCEKFLNFLVSGRKNCTNFILKKYCLFPTAKVKTKPRKLFFLNLQFFYRKDASRFSVQLTCHVWALILVLAAFPDFGDDVFRAAFFASRVERHVRAAFVFLLRQHLSERSFHVFTKKSRSLTETGSCCDRRSTAPFFLKDFRASHNSNRSRIRFFRVFLKLFLEEELIIKRLFILLKICYCLQCRKTIEFLIEIINRKSLIINN